MKNLIDFITVQDTVYQSSDIAKMSDSQLIELAAQCERVSQILWIQVTADRQLCQLDNLIMNF